MSAPRSLSSPVSVRQRTLEAAADCVLRDRNVTHGEPENSFREIAIGWSVIAGCEIDETKACLMMVWLKTVRAKNNPDHPDNFIDLCGYGSCASECADILRMQKERDID
jgi:hypothetical protein